MDQNNKQQQNVSQTFIVKGDLHSYTEINSSQSRDYAGQLIIVGLSIMIMWALVAVIFNELAAFGRWVDLHSTEVVIGLLTLVTAPMLMGVGIWYGSKIIKRRKQEMQRRQAAQNVEIIWKALETSGKNPETLTYPEFRAYIEERIKAQYGGDSLSLPGDSNKLDELARQSWGQILVAVGRQAA